VAIIWFHPDVTPISSTPQVFPPLVCDGTLRARGRQIHEESNAPYRVVTELGYLNDVFPVSYALPSNITPPPAALIDLSQRPPLFNNPNEVFVPGSGSVAFGAVIVYDDNLRSNLGFDQGTPHGPGDPIIAGSGSELFQTDVIWRVMYLDGTPYWLGDLAGDGGLLQQLNAPQGVSHYREERGGALQSFTTSTPIPLAPSNGRSHATALHLQCTDLWYIVLQDGLGPQEPGTQIQCHDDGTNRYWSFEERRSLGFLGDWEELIEDCQQTTHYGVACIPAASPNPSGWPCP
jgi:hypothetical protein